MGNKPRRECDACGAVFKDRGAAQDRCPRCDALCVRKAPPAQPPRASKRAADEGAPEVFLRTLDACTTLVDAPGPAFAAALACLAAAPLLAVDVEGERLSRTGRVTLLQVATAERVFIFDVLALGAEAFDAQPAGDTGAPLGLRALLEDADRTKLMWDVRRDSDALHHQHAVSLADVLDVQLAAVAVRRADGAAVPSLPGLPQTLARFLSKVCARAC